jgi:hypothetical protein
VGKRKSPLQSKLNRLNPEKMGSALSMIYGVKLKAVPVLTLWNTSDGSASGEDSPV